jgi:hypothetical protein
MGHEYERHLLMFPGCCCWCCCCCHCWWWCCWLQVSFQPLLGGAAAKVQQAMLMAVSKEQPSLAAYAVAKAKKDGMHVITLAVAGMEKQLGSLVRQQQQQTQQQR